MTYYNAIVKTDYSSVTYHQITNVDRFIAYVKNNLSVKLVYFYQLPFRVAKKGSYCFTYNADKNCFIYPNEKPLFTNNKN